MFVFGINWLQRETHKFWCLKRSLKWFNFLFAGNRNFIFFKPSRLSFCCLTCYELLNFMIFFFAMEKDILSGSMNSPAQLTSSIKRLRKCFLSYSILIIIIKLIDNNLFIQIQKYFHLFPAQTKICESNYYYYYYLAIDIV